MADRHMGVGVGCVCVCVSVCVCVCRVVSCVVCACDDRCRWMSVVTVVTVVTVVALGRAARQLGRPPLIGRRAGGSLARCAVRPIPSDDALGTAAVLGRGRVGGGGGGGEQQEQRPGLLADRGSTVVTAARHGVAWDPKGGGGHARRGGGGGGTYRRRDAGSCWFSTTTSRRVRRARRDGDDAITLVARLACWLRTEQPPRRCAAPALGFSTSTAARSRATTMRSVVTPAWRQ